MELKVHLQGHIGRVEGIFPQNGGHFFELPQRVALQGSYCLEDLVKDMTICCVVKLIRNAFTRRVAIN